MDRLKALENANRYMRNGKLMLNLLRYDVEWVVRRWGYFDKKSTCEYFEFVVSLFKKDLEEEAKKTTAPKSKSKKILPEEESKTVASVFESKSADTSSKESL